MRYKTLGGSLNDQVLFKLFLDKWDGSTQVVPGISGWMPPIIVGENNRGKKKMNNFKNIDIKYI